MFTDGKIGAFKVRCVPHLPSMIATLVVMTKC